MPGAWNVASQWTLVRHQGDRVDLGVEREARPGVVGACGEAQPFAVLVTAEPDAVESAECGRSPHLVTSTRIGSPGCVGHGSGYSTE